MKAVRIPTITPVFPKTCPGCERTADAMDRVEAGNRWWVHIPMCGACAGKRRKATFLFTCITLVVVLALVPVYLWLGDSASRPGIPDGLNPFMRNHAPVFPWGWLAFVPIVATVGGIFFAGRLIPRFFAVEILDAKKEGSPFLVFTAKNKEWLAELERLNPS